MKKITFKRISFILSLVLFFSLPFMLKTNSIKVKADAQSGYVGVHKTYFLAEHVGDSEELTQIAYVGETHEEWGILVTEDLLVVTINADGTGIMDGSKLGVGTLSFNWEEKDTDLYISGGDLGDGPAIHCQYYEDLKVFVIPFMGDGRFGFYYEKPKPTPAPAPTPTPAPAPVSAPTEEVTDEMSNNQETTKKPATSEVKKASAVKTGDENNVITVAILAISLLGIGTTIFLKKKN